MFNPNSRKLTSQEWQIIACESIEDSNSQYLIIAGIIGGLIAASATAFPPTGFLIAVWSFHAAWKRTQKGNRNQIAINYYGCVAHVLCGDNLRDFRNQVGNTEAIEQIKWAVENGYPASNDALNLLDTQSLLLPDKIKTSSTIKTPLAVSDSDNKETQLVTFEQEIPNLPASFALSLKNSLIVGVPGSGKGIFVTNALEYIKQDKQRQVKVFYIDPKNDPNETNYFSGRVDYLFRKDLMTCNPVEAYEWLQNSIKKFDEFDAQLGYKLLVFDELNLVTKTLKRVDGGLGWLEGKLTGYSSSGSSRGIVVWGISQNAHTKGLGFDGGTRSIFIPVFIISADNVSASEGILRATMIPSDRRISTTQIQSLCQKSSVGRAIFYGGLNEWFSMPKLPNYSGFDRDNRCLIGE